MIGTFGSVFELEILIVHKILFREKVSSLFVDFKNGPKIKNPTIGRGVMASLVE